MLGSDPHHLQEEKKYQSLLVLLDPPDGIFQSPATNLKNAFQQIYFFYPLLLSTLLMFKKEQVMPLSLQF
jgi:hypothetical protein